MNTYLSQCGVSVQKLNDFKAGCIEQFLGIRITAIGPDFITGEMPVNERTQQPFGLLHGGASMVLAESLGSYASILLLHDPAAKAVGIEIGGNHLHSVRAGKVIATCRPMKLGRSVHFWRIDIHDDTGRLCCAARLTVMVRRGSAGAGGD